MEEDIKDFIGYYKETKRASDNTLQSYKRDLMKMYKFMTMKGIDKASDITVTNVNAYLMYLEKEGLSSSTISRNIASMRAFFRYLLKNRKIDYEPVEFVKSPSIEKKLPVVLSVEEVDKLLGQLGDKTLKEVRDKAMIELMYATGIRVSEIINLKLTAVHMDMEYIECKDEKKERIIPFGKSAKKALEKYLTEARKEMVKDECEYFFVNCKGSKMSRQGFWKIIKLYGEKAGIKGEITPHIIRHSFAAHLIANGAELGVVKEMMGHSDIASTQIYEYMKTAKIRNTYERTHPRS